MTSIDGKAIKGMTERVNGGKPRYFMNAQKSGGTISLASREVGEKKNEISELPGFISSLSIENNVITIDAIGTQQAVIDMILKKEGTLSFAGEVQPGEPVGDNQGRSGKKKIRRLF